MADGLKIRIDGDTAGFKKVLEGLGGVASKAAGVAVKGISAASAGVVALTGLAVKSYAEYEQLVGGVDTLFEASSQKVQQNAANAYKTAGVSANEYMQMATSFSASLKQSFDDTEAGISAAADAADVAITDMADNANKMGTPMERITDAYQGFAKQNYTMLDNLKLGYGGTKGEMERLLKDAQELSGVKYDINNLADVYSAIHVIQTELGITGTTAKEAASTIEGSASMMKASWENLMVGLADDNADFDGLLENFTNSVLTFGDNILPRIQTVLDGIGEFITGAAETLLPKVVEVIIETLPTLVNAAGQLVSSLGSAILDNLPLLIDTASGMIGTLVSGLIDNLPAIIDAGMTILEYLARGLIESLPVLIPTVVDLVMTIESALLDNVDMLIDIGIELIFALADGFSEGRSKLIERAPEIISKLIDALVENAPKLIQAAGELIIQLSTGLITSLPSLISKIPTIIADIVSGFIEYKGNMNDVGKNLIDGVWEGIKSTFSSLLSNLSGLIDLIPGTVKKLLGIHSPSTVMRDEVGKMIPAGVAVGISAGESSVIGSLEHLNNEMLEAEKAYQVEAEHQEAEAFKRKYAEKRKNADDELDLAKKNAADLLEEDKKSAKDRYDEQIKTAEKSSEEKKYQAALDLKRAKEDAKTALDEELAKAKDSEDIQKAHAKYKKKLKDEQLKYDRKLEDIAHDESEKKAEAHSDYLIDLEKAEAKEKEKITEATNEHTEKLAEISEEELAEIEENSRKKRLEDLKKDAEKAKKLYEETAAAIEKISKRQAEELEESQNSIRDNFDNTINEALDKLQELGDLQDSLSEKVDDYGSLYNDVSLPTIELANGISMTPTKTELADLGKQNEELEEYLDIINSLKKRGNVPTELFNKFREMSVEEGTKFGQALLDADDETFNNYIKEFEEKGKLGAEISKALTEEEFKETAKTLTDKFGMLPEEFFEFGADAGKQFGEGFVKEITTMFKDFKDFLNVSLSGLSPTVALPAQASNSSYNYTSNYFIQPQEGTSTLSQMRAIRRFEILKELGNFD